MNKKCIIGTHETMFSQMVACVIRLFDAEILITETRTLDELFKELDSENELVFILDPRTFGFEFEAVCKKIYTVNPQSLIICLCQEKCSKFFGLRLYRCGVNCIISNVETPKNLLAVMRNAFDGIGYYPKEICDAVKMREHFMMPDFCSALTHRELELISYLVNRNQTKYIATALGITENTVWSMTNRIIKKVGVATKDELIKLALDVGMLGI